MKGREFAGEPSKSGHHLRASKNWGWCELGNVPEWVLCIHKCQSGRVINRRESEARLSCNGEGMEGVVHVPGLSYVKSITFTNQNLPTVWHDAQKLKTDPIP